MPLPLTLAAMYHLPGDPAGFNQYGRFANPTWDAVERLLGHLEDATAVAFPSGMAATSAVLFGLLKTGDRILLPSDGYYTTRVLADRFLKPMGIAIDTRPTATFLDGGFDGYRLVFVESPSNPNLDICDIAAVAAAAHQAGAIVVADNTTMTPYGQRPLDLGADAVVAADTKAPSGHSDVLFGHVTSRNPEIIAAVDRLAKAVGRDPRPVRGMAGPSRAGDAGGPLRPHVHVGRDDRQRLAGHPAVGAVRYPGLPDDPGPQSGAHADGPLRLPDRPDAGQRTGGGKLHRRLRADPAGDLVRRRAQLGRAPRPLGRRGRAGLCQAVGRLRAGRGIVEGDCGGAGQRRLAGPQPQLTRHVSARDCGCRAVREA